MDANMKKQAVLVLIMFILIPRLISCGNDIGSDETSPVTAESSAPESDSDGESSGVPNDLDLNNIEINIWTLDDAYYSALDPELSGDILDDAVYNLNRSVMEKLNCRLNFIHSNAAQANCNTEIQKVILADDRSFDLFNATEWSGSKLVAEKLYLNIADAPYLSLDSDWWDRDYMAEMSVGNDSLYTLVGDCTLDRTRFLNCVYYNRTMYEQFYGDADNMYDVVDSGKWTYDYIKSVGKDVYSDLDSNQQQDIRDRMAICINWNGNINALYYCTDAMITKRSPNGIPELVMGRERNIDNYMKLYDLVMNSVGVIYDPDPDTTYNLPIFRDGLTMYLGGFLHFADKLRDMEDDYGILPLPKVDEEQDDYISMLHQAARFMALPVNCQKTDAVCAVLEEMAYIGHSELLPTYYETVLKEKYARDEESARMLDLIHANVRADIAYIFASDFGDVCFIPRSLMKDGSVDFASAYAGLEDSAKEKAEAFIENFSKATE